MYSSLFIMLLAGTVACSGSTERPGQGAQEEMARLRKQMVDEQIIARGISDSRVLEALNRVERHAFVLPGYEKEAYSDGPLPIGEGQTISQPYIVALMTELALIGPKSRVLEVGTGSGYQAAILAEIAAEVYSIEIIEKLGLHAKEKLKTLGYANVHVRIGDGYQGWTEHAPFDAVLVTAAPDHVPQPLVDQLKVGGRLVIPVGSYYQSLKVILKTPTGVEEQSIVPVRFVPMTGEAQKE